MRKLVYFTLAFVAGTLLSQYLLPPLGRLILEVSVGLVFLAALLIRSKTGRWLRWLPLAVVGLGLGLVWFAGYEAIFTAPAQRLAGTEDVVTVELLDYAQETDYGAKATVRVLDWDIPGKAVYFSGWDLLDLEPGNQITAVAEFDEAVTVGDETSTYYTSQGVFLRLYGDENTETVKMGRAGSLRYLPQRLARGLREAISERFSPKAGGLITALLTGEREDMDEQSRTDLEETGLLHITAVSGLHCSFLIGLMGLLLGRRRRLTAMVGYPVLLFYMLMVGGTPSVVRACVMTGLFLLGPLLGREGDAPTSLAAAALVILLGNPFAVASISFQLSFASVAGLLLISPRVYRTLTGLWPAERKWAKALWSFVLGTVAASLGTLLFTAPLSAFYFQYLSLVSPLSNLLVLWAAPFLFAFALVLTPLTMALPALMPLLALPEALAQYVLTVSGALAKLPGHAVYFTGAHLIAWLIFCYLLLAVCLISRERKRKYAFAAVLAAVGLLAARSLPGLALGDNRLTMIAVDVGQGAATLLRSGETTVLVDCGSLYAPLGPGTLVADTMASYGWDKLDKMVLTHYHEDHAGGLGELMARVEIKELLLPQLSGSDDQGNLQAEVLSLAEAYNVPVTYVEEPYCETMGEAELTIYPPLTEGDVNEEGLTILCTAGDFDVLITGDMNGSTEKLLVETYDLPDIEVLMVGHHGSKYSTTEELLEAVTPETGIISVGENNFGHPTAEAMDRMAWQGMTLYRTDLQGNIMIQAGG